jgi:hypothetical protein
MSQKRNAVELGVSFPTARLDLETADIFNVVEWDLITLDERINNVDQSSRRFQLVTEFFTR